jgi:hypothetical protein
MAVHPFENAVRSAKVVSNPVCPSARATAGGTGTSVPVSARQAPSTMSVRMLPMKKYVGSAKIRPESRMPRRLPNIRTATKASESSTRLTCRCGSADVTAAMPAAMLTATVST